MDPGLRLIDALFSARAECRRLGRLLPDWPQDIKDIHGVIQRDLDTAWGMAWEVYTAPPDGTEANNPGKDATVADDEVCTHPYEPPDNASLYDDPPSRPA